LTVAKAFIRAAKQNTNIRLLMLGTGSLAPNVRRLFKRAAFTKLVYFPGQVGYDKLPEYFRAADVYLSASHSDGSSVSLVEAMASGLPAIVSDIPSNREWVNSKNGWLFPVKKHRELTELILKASHSVGIERLGKHSRRIATKKANWNRNKKVLLNAYKHALQVA
jgi:glycosyltransferase involved in cell wall biosynthesis